MKNEEMIKYLEADLRAVLKKKELVSDKIIQSTNTFEKKEFLVELEELTFEQYYITGRLQDLSKPLVKKLTKRLFKQ